jgi:trehalose 2-sulfotransferase
MPGYAICTEPRSGSVFLARVLASTGVLGRPAEYFNASAIRFSRGIADYPDNPEAQLAAIPTLGASDNGVYAVKVFSVHFDAIRATRWTRRLPGLSFIHLERHDLLGQAMSHVRAIQTQQWTSAWSAEREPAYDGEAINAELVRIVRAQTRWRYYFARNGIPVLNLVYEQVMQAPQATAEAVGRLIGLAEPPRVDLNLLGDLKIQRDALSDAWRARFLAEQRNLDIFY